MRKQLEFNILVMTHNTYGKGKTIIEAKENAGMPREYEIYIVPFICHVDPVSGNLMTPADDFLPVCIETKQRNKRRGE